MDSGPQCQIGQVGFDAVVVVTVVFDIGFVVDVPIGLSGAADRGLPRLFVHSLPLL